METKEKLLKISKALTTLKDFNDHLGVIDYYGSQNSSKSKEFLEIIFLYCYTQICFKETSEKFGWLLKNNYYLTFGWENPKKKKIITILDEQSDYYNTIRNGRGHLIDRNGQNDKSIKEIKDYVYSKLNWLEKRGLNLDYLFTTKEIEVDNTELRKHYISFGKIKCYITEEEKDDLIKNIKDDKEKMDLESLDKLFAELAK